MEDGFKKGKNSSTTNNSALSLHIAVYENSDEAAAAAPDSFVGKTECLYRLSKKGGNAKQNSVGSASMVQISFEFPRQQENEASELQIGQFKASQRLLNPNESVEEDKGQPSPPPAEIPASAPPAPPPPQPVAAPINQSQQQQVAAAASPKINNNNNRRGVEDNKVLYKGQLPPSPPGTPAPPPPVAPINQPQQQQVAAAASPNNNRRGDGNNNNREKGGENQQQQRNVKPQKQPSCPAQPVQKKAANITAVGPPQPQQAPAAAPANGQPQQPGGNRKVENETKSGQQSLQQQQQQQQQSPFLQQNDISIYSGGDKEYLEALSPGPLDPPFYIRPQNLHLHDPRYSYLPSEEEISNAMDNSTDDPQSWGGGGGDDDVMLDEDGTVDVNNDEDLGGAEEEEDQGGRPAQAVKKKAPILPPANIITVGPPPPQQAPAAAPANGQPQKPDGNGKVENEMKSGHVGNSWEGEDDHMLNEDDNVVVNDEEVPAEEEEEAGMEVDDAAESNVKKRKNKSVYWEYVEKDGENVKCIIKDCGKIIKIYNNKPSNIQSHLKNIHRNIYSALNPAGVKRKQNDCPNGPRNKCKKNAVAKESGLLDVEILVGGEEEEGEGGWEMMDSDLKLPAAMDTQDEESPPTRGQPPAFYWPNNSRLVADHVAAGSFDSAARLLMDTIGVIQIAPFKELFLNTYATSRIVYKTLPLSISNLAYPLRSEATEKSGLPAISIQLDELCQRLQACYRLTTEGKFGDAITKLRQIILHVPLLVVDSKQKVAEAQQLIEICRKYLVGLLMEVERRSNATNSEAEKIRSLEVAAYFTHCDLQPLHEILTLRTAVKLSYGLKQFKMCASFAQRCIELGPKPDIAQKMRKVLAACGRNPKDAHKINYDEHNPFVVCSRTFVPLYRGNPQTKCPFCGTSFDPKFNGEICNVCEVSEIGKDVIGLRINTVESGR